MLRDHGIEQLRHGLLAGLGQAGDGIELLLDPGGWTALTGKPDGGASHQQLVEREVEQLGERGEQRRDDADTADLVMSESLLGDAEPIGELRL